jgi:hypothetical protein
MQLHHLRTVQVRTPQHWEDLSRGCLKTQLRPNGGVSGRRRRQLLQIPMRGRERPVHGNAARGRGHMGSSPLLGALGRVFTTSGGEGQQPATGGEEGDDGRRNCLVTMAAGSYPYRISLDALQSLLAALPDRSNKCAGVHQSSWKRKPKQAVQLQLNIDVSVCDIVRVGR